jgi:glutamine amidotransferase
MKKSIGIIDYSISNLTSVINAFKWVGAEPTLVQSAADVSKCSHLVLPGVGSFPAGMKNLRAKGFDEAISRFVEKGNPLIGMCLGMQLLSEAGEEFGNTRGLGLIPGRVSKMNVEADKLRLPHIGWNDVDVKSDSRLMGHFEEKPIFYFVHSFVYADCNETYVKGTCDYGGPQVAYIEHENIFGAQFHPEKSQKDGLSLLKTFVELAD